MAGEYEYPINLSLVRPHLVAGVEKIGLCASIIPAGVGILVAGQSGYRYAAALVVLSVLMYIGFRRLAKDDPYMCMVYFRSWRYRRIYAPRPTVHKRYGRRVPRNTKKVLVVSGIAVFFMSIIVIGIMVAF